jgi:hypothetical protein
VYVLVHWAGVTAIPARGGYTVEDLDWGRLQVEMAYAELDPRENLIVSPATDLHERAISVLHALVRQLRLPVGSVLTGLAWKGASGTHMCRTSPWCRC